MRRLHGFLHNTQQVLPQLAQVHLAAQRSTERLHGFGCIILTAVETAVNDGLDAMAQGLEESRNGEGRGDYRYWRL
jgi:hypothetical protein